MQVGALRPYEYSLLTGEPLRLHHDDGQATILEVNRWLDPADEVDTFALSRAVAPALDVGCGPGRIVAALAELGVLTLGIDIAETAVSMTRDRGLNALRRSVFAQLPGEGRWMTVLLLDGNIGIGGDPAMLLGRVRQLLAPSGQVIVETHSDQQRDEQLLVRFTHTGDPIGPRFPWANVGLDALYRHAGEVGFSVSDTWSAGGRTFASLVPLAR